MARKAKNVQYFKYKCPITGAEYTTTKKADNPDELISVAGHYELNPEEDDRPEIRKVKVKTLKINGDE